MPRPRVQYGLLLLLCLLALRSAVRAGYLFAEQIEDGEWEDETSMGPKDTLGTCFALLFLKRATPPVITGAPQPR